MSQSDHLLDQVRRLALRGMGERQTDGQLLELFISERDESAFALLLRRHGAMVWSVCRRVLGNAHHEHRTRVDAIRKQHRELLDKQLQQFDQETRERLAQAEKVNERILAGRATNQPSPSPSQKQVSGNKLDRILEYLERLEKRLDRLEKTRQ